MVQELAVFPGSFDPLTMGHVDIVTRASKLFAKVVVAVLANPNKTGFFPVEDRVRLIRESFAPYSLPVEVASFDGLLVDFLKGIGARFMIRGLRAVSDYEYEAQMALMNRRLSPEVDTFFLMAREDYSYISSTVVRQIALLGGDVSGLVPAPFNDALQIRSTISAK